MVDVITVGPQETHRLAENLGRCVRSGDVLLINGALGAGKTTFVQGLAEGMGTTEPVTSPTFTLVHEYRSGRLPLIHLDPYRLSSEAEIFELGFDEWLERDCVIAVEWGDNLGSLAPPEYLKVKIESLPDDRRNVRFVPHGSRWNELLAELGYSPC